jgi:hypothetical protein
LNIELTGATTLQKKRDQFKQWIMASQDMCPYIGCPYMDIALKYRQRTGKKTGKKSIEMGEVTLCYLVVKNGFTETSCSKYSINISQKAWPRAKGVLQA